MARDVRCFIQREGAAMIERYKNSSETYNVSCTDRNVGRRRIKRKWNNAVQGWKHRDDGCA